MVGFTYVVTLLDGPVTYLTGISDMAVQIEGGAIRLYSVTGPGGGLSVFDIGDDITLNSQWALAAAGSVSAPLQLEFAAIDDGGGSAGVGAAAILTYGQPDQGLSGQWLALNGDFDGSFSLEAPPGQPDQAFSALEVVMLGGQQVFFSAALGSAGLNSWISDGSGGLQRLAEILPDSLRPGVDIADLDQVTINGEVYLLVISAFDNTLSSYRLGTGLAGSAPLGEASLVARIGADGGLGIASPAALDVVQMAGQDYVLLAASGTSSISVVAIGPDGTLSVTDQVNDDLNTRFQGLETLATLELNDRVYIIAGGGDDGLSLLTLLPGGRLLHLDSFADTLAATLSNVSAITAVARDGQIEVFAAGTGEAGITQMRIDPGPVGQVLTGNDSSNFISGSAGNDLISGGDGDDTLRGLEGDDILMDGDGSDHLWGGAGADVFVLTADGVHDVIEDFEIGIDRIDLSGLGRAYTLSALELQSLAGGLRITFAGESLDIFTIDGRSLDPADLDIQDVFDLWHVQIDQAVNAQILTGTAFDDTLRGGAADDVLTGLAGGDLLIGGLGVDTVSYQGSRGSLRVDLMFPSINTNHAAGDSYDSIENLIGSQGFDNLRGTLEGNLIQGMSNVDYIFGRRGDDTLEGGIGDDVLFGGVGVDVLIGGAHRDRAQYSESLSALVLDLQDPWRNTGEAAGDSYDSIEDLAGGGFDDLIYGDTGANRLFGREGADQLYGRDGDDYLNGGAHADRLDGGLGDDTLRGGQNNDTFVFNGGSDVIEDFTFAHNDRIAIEAAAITAVAGLTGLEIVSRYASVVGGQVVFDFGGGNLLTLEGISSLVGLSDDIFAF